MGCPSVRYRWSGLDCLSKVLSALSFLGLAASLSLFVGALWLKLEVGDHLDLAIPKEGYLWPASLALGVALVAPSHLLGVGLRTSLAKNFTSVKLFRRSGKCLNRLLIVHAVVSLVSGILVFGVCAGGAYFWGISRRRVKQGLYQAVRRYPVDAATKLRLDRLQIDLGCCGSETYADWFFVPWMDSARDDAVFGVVNEDDYDVDPAVRSVRRIKPIGRGPAAGPYFSADVPYSCCNATLKECSHHGMIARDSYKPEALASISSVGCHPRLLDRANAAGGGVIACLLVVTVYQIIVAVLARLLQTARLYALRANAKGEFFVGWIFGSAPRDRRGGDDATEMEKLRDGATAEDSSSSNQNSSPLPPVRQSGGGGEEILVRKKKKSRARMLERRREQRNLNSTVGVFGACSRRLFKDRSSPLERKKKSKKRSGKQAYIDDDDDDDDEPAGVGPVDIKGSRSTRRRTTRRTAESSSSSSPPPLAPAALPATPKRASRSRKAATAAAVTHGRRIGVSGSCPLHVPGGTTRKLSSSGSSSCCPVHGCLR